MDRSLHITAVKHRDDIDGLRAIAVLSVIFFHANFEVMSGGFLGVDAFFAISGFLITSIVFREIDLGKFTISNFFVRRIKRIVPAALFVTLTTGLLGWFILMPVLYKEFFQSSFALSFFSTNFLFIAKNSSYFSQATELKPFIHTWTLAIEEQFYIFFPFFALMLYKTKQKISLIITLCILSFAIQYFLSGWNSSFGFYMSIGRFWELGLGCLSAVATRYEKNIKNSPKILKQALSIFGLFALLIMQVLFEQLQISDQMGSAIVVISTCLILMFNEPTFFSWWVLGLRPLIWIGLISYSAYLWHQPIFVFLRLLTNGDPSTFSYICTTLLVLGISYFSWRFIENPVRLHKSKGKIALVLLPSYVILLSSLGLFGHFNKGFPDRLVHLPITLASMSAYPGDILHREPTCFLYESQRPSDFSDECFIEQDNSGNQLLIWGDSHAASVQYGLFRYAKFAGFAQLTASGCPPLVGYQFSSKPNCSLINDFVDFYLRSAPPITVVIQSGWNGHKFEDNLFLETVERITSYGHRVVVLGVLPQWGKSLPQVYFDQSMNEGFLVDFRKEFPSLPNRIFPSDIDNLHQVDARIARLAKKAGVKFYSPLDILCNQLGCLGIVDGENGLMFSAWDYGHLTYEGSSFLGRRLAELMAE